MKKLISLVVLLSAFVTQAQQVNVIAGKYEYYDLRVRTALAIPNDTFATALCGRSLALKNNVLYYKNSSCVWQVISGGGSSGWGLTGNAGTVLGTNFIGNTDLRPLSFRTNNLERFRITAGGNMMLGTATDSSQRLVVNGNIKADNISIGSSLMGSGATTYGLSIGKGFFSGNTGVSSTLQWDPVNGFLTIQNVDGSSQYSISPYAMNAGGITTNNPVITSYGNVNGHVEVGMGGSSSDAAYNTKPYIAADGQLIMVPQGGTYFKRVGTNTMYIEGGTATNAPLRIAAGTNLTTPVDGSIEYNGTHWFATIGSVRHQLDQQGGGLSSVNLNYNNETNTVTNTAGSGALLTVVDAGHDGLFPKTLYPNLFKKKYIGNATGHGDSVLYYPTDSTILAYTFAHLSGSGITVAKQKFDSTWRYTYNAGGAITSDIGWASSAADKNITITGVNNSSDSGLVVAKSTGSGIVFHSQPGANGTGLNVGGTTGTGVMSFMTGASAYGAYNASNGANGIATFSFAGALTGTGVDATGGAYGVRSNTGAGISVFGEASNGNGGRAFSFGINDANNNPTQNQVLGSYHYELNSATPSTGLGLTLEYRLQSSTTRKQLAAQTFVDWTDATHATRTGRYGIGTVNSGTMSTKFEIAGSGQLRLNTYGTGSPHTGTIVKYLGVDANGYVVPGTPSGGGGGGGMVIGDPVSGGTQGQVLYTDAGGDLAQDAGLVYDQPTTTLYTPTIRSTTATDLTLRAATSQKVSIVTGGLERVAVNSGGAIVINNGSDAVTLPSTKATEDGQVLTGSASGTTQFTSLRKTSTITSSSTLSPTGDAMFNYLTVSALAANATISAPSGTIVNDNWLAITIADNATPRTLTWNSVFKDGDIPLPSTTVTSNITTHSFKSYVVGGTTYWMYMGATNITP